MFHDFFLLFQDQYERAASIIEKNKVLIEELSNKLYEKKSLTEDDVREFIELHGPVKEP